MQLLLQHWRSQKIQLAHIRTTLRQSNAEKGRLDLHGVWAFVRIWLRYCRELRRWRPDVVLLLLSSSWIGFVRDAVLILTARFWGAVVVVQYRGGNFAGFFAAQSWWRRRFIRWILQRVAAVLVQSPRLRSQFAGIVEEQRLHVLPNGIDVQHIPQRRRVVAEAAPYRLLFVGHIAFSKGFRELGRAYLRLCREFPVELWVVGTRIADPRVVALFLPPEWRAYYVTHADTVEAEIESFLAEREQHNVRLLGIVSAPVVREWMAQADLFVLPSYSEGFPMAVLEAMACGLPVVVTPVGAVGELVQHGVHGRLVPVGDADALWGALRECLQQPDWMREAGEHNRREVAERFRIERVVAGLEQIVSELVRARGNG